MRRCSISASGELLVVLIVAFVVVGPDDLPRVARWLGRQVRRLKQLLRDIKAETGFDEVEREIHDVQKDVRQTVKALDISADLNAAADEIKGEAAGAANELKRELRQMDVNARQELSVLESSIQSDAKDKEAIP